MEDFNTDSIINLLATDNYIIVNRSIVKEFGLKEAVLLGELASEYNYYKKNNLLDENGYFYSTIENVETNTTLSVYEQKKCLETLISRNVVDVVVKGIPATRHIRLNSYTLVNLFANNLETSLRETNNLVCEKIATKNNKNNNNNNNKEINKERKKDIEEIVEYLNLTLETKYRPSSAFTKHINARLDEGYTKEDFYDVIENKYEEWHGTEMEKYLRPDTLFGTKFDIYLNQK